MFASKSIVSLLFGNWNVKPYYAKTEEEHKDFIMNRKLKSHIWFGDPREVGIT